MIEKTSKGFFSDNEKLIGHRLIVNCPTRWNSSLDMLKRVLEQTPAIMAVANDKKINKKHVRQCKRLLFDF